MRVSFELKERHFLFLVGILAVVSAVGIVTGYGGSSPSTMGHTPGEIGPGTFSGSGSDIWSFPGTVESKSGGFKFPDGGVQESACNFDIKRGYIALVTGITYHQITPTNYYDIPVTLPDNTKAVIIGCRYTHGGGANHGYLDFWAYQKGATADEDKTFFYNRHYNDYYNTDYYELIVPWNEELEDVITINVTSSYYTGGGKYDIYYAGYIAA
jgi:hypothetical protein